MPERVWSDRRVHWWDTTVPGDYTRQLTWTSPSVTGRSRGMKNETLETNGLLPLSF